ncbi:hypothetical protein [Xenorhabdus cabanillasii]|uniref:hypothetical protein n=1 Tax=Xenorhabdus cabanillasii TaxID=351673 RepID=UPI000C04B378|nr:hypothetical protein [Xenorhabdus cabanillasii]
MYHKSPYTPYVYRKARMLRSYPLYFKLPLTGGQRWAGQIRSRRICHSLATATQLEIHWV